MKKKMLLNILMSGFFGVTLGLLISLVVNTSYGFTDFFYAPPVLVSRMGSHLAAAWFLFVGTFVFGVGFYVISLIQKVEGSLLKCSLYHYFGSLVWFFLGGYVLGFFPLLNFTTILLNLLVFSGLYLAIWVVIYFYYKITFAKINRKL